MYFESHAHYDDRAFDADRDELLSRLYSEGISYVINSGSNLESSRFGIELSKKYGYIYAAAGVHPHEAATLSEEGLNELEALCKSAVAVGEIGLDYHYEFSPRDVQVYWFEKQLSLAKRLGLPVIIHSREADKETLDIVKKTGLSARDGRGAGVIHCFSGSLETALQYVDMGYLIGVGGVITFDKAKKLERVVSGIPIESILLETDCPYLAPKPNRGKRNDSLNLKYIAARIGEILQKPHEEVAAITEENGKRLFL